MILTARKGLAAYLAEYGGGRLPEIAGRYSGGLAICGDAACVWDDLEAFGCRTDAGKGAVSKPGFHFMAINKIGETFPGDLEHWFSNSAAHLSRFAASRRDEYAREFAAPKNTHACHDGAMWRWPWSGHGTSALGAALSGVAMGYAPITLCGVPLDESPHNGEPPWRKCKFTSEVKEQDRNWLRAIDLVFEGTVFSMSGRTREWLGSPK